MVKLGEGQFGTVFLVTNNNNNNNSSTGSGSGSSSVNKNKPRYYALKCISKYETIKNKL